MLHRLSSFNQKQGDFFMKKSLIVSFFLISFFSLPFASYSFDGNQSAGPIDGFMYTIDQDKLVKVSQQDGKKYYVPVFGARSVPNELWLYQGSLVLRLDVPTFEISDENEERFKSKIFLLNRRSNQWNEIGEDIIDLYVINSTLMGIDTERKLNVFRDGTFQKLNTERIDIIVRERIEQWASVSNEHPDMFFKVRRDKTGRFHAPVIELKEAPANTEDQYIVLFRDGTWGHLSRILGQ